jgi:hypothetical protein
MPRHEQPIGWAPPTPTPTLCSPGACRDWGADGTTEASVTVTSAVQIAASALSPVCMSLTVQPTLFERMRDAGNEMAVLSQNAGRQDEHLLEVCCPRLDL